MKYSLLLTLLSLGLNLPLWAAPCDALKLDLEKGTLSGAGGSISLKSKLAEIKKALPCAPESFESMQGTGLFYARQGFLIAPGHLLTVFGSKPPFKGSLTPSILHKSLSEVESLLGVAEYSVQEATETEGSFYTHAFYSRSWGTLILKYNPKNRLEELSLSADSLKELLKQYPQAGEQEEIPL